MGFVLAYQPEGTSEIKSVPIPEGYEDQIDDVISKGNGIKIKKLGVDLKHDEIKGLMTEEWYQNLSQTFWTEPQAPEEIKGAGYKTFLELGVALQQKQSLDKWKKKYGEGT